MKTNLPMKQKMNVRQRSENVKNKARNGMFNAVFSRMGLVVVLLAVQIFGLLFAVNRFVEYGWLAYGAMMLLSVAVVIHIINEKGNPAFKLAWIIPILVLPVFGAAFYLFCQVQWGTKFMSQRLSSLWIVARPYMEQDESALKELRIDNPSNANLANFMHSQVGFPVHRNTKVKFFPLGEDMFREMVIKLKQAQEYIFMEYFIVEKGLMWGTILEILEDKVKEGVEVRFMYDGMCSISMLPSDYPSQLQRKGIQCKIYGDIKPILSTSQNNRDHRKICVIDGKIGFTGGINLGDEYINQKERFGHWKDTAIMLRGEAVQSLTQIFLQMWNLTEKRPENYRRYLTPKIGRVRSEYGYVLPYADSPFDNENVGEQVYFHILNHAKKYVHIMTPYLILDNEMITNLTFAAKCGIEVIIIMPHIPDKWYAFTLAKTYYSELIQAGVQIYEYTPGFVHAKIFVSDDDTATVGTINLDYRSLFLHFECGAFIYNNPVVRDIEDDFQHTLARCQKVSLVDVNNRNFVSKAAGNVFRLFAPLM